MNDETAAPAEPPPADPPPPPPSRARRRWKLVLAGVLVTPILLFALYTAVVLTWSYSAGNRAGVLQKFSYKGWVCKTWEGELAMSTVPGVAPVIWEFTVRDDGVAKLVNGAIGKRVVLHYEEHLGVPTSCFGQTRYFVDAVEISQ